MQKLTSSMVRKAHISGSSHEDKWSSCELGGGFSKVAEALILASPFLPATAFAMSMDRQAMMVPSSHSRCCAGVFSFRPYGSWVVRTGPGSPSAGLNLSFENVLHGYPE